MSERNVGGVWLRDYRGNDPLNCWTISAIILHAHLKKFSGVFDRIQINDLCDAGAVFLSFELWIHSDVSGLISWAHVFPWKEWGVKEMLVKCGWEMNYGRTDPESQKCILLVCLSLAKVRDYLQYRLPFKCNMIHSTYMKHTTWSVDHLHIYYLLGSKSVLEKNLPEVLTGIQPQTQSFVSYMDWVTYINFFSVFNNSGPACD